MSKVIYFLLISLAIIFTVKTDVLAKRVLPQFAGLKNVSVNRSGNVARNVRFRADRRAVILALTNLAAVSSVEYSLTYESRGTTQGVNGTIFLSGSSSEVREILFGTCSKGVCRYDTGITNARLVVTSNFKNGKRVIKPYRLKV